jgi:hypothetical protein
MDTIRMRTSFGGDIFVQSVFQTGWEVSISVPRHIQTGMGRQLLVPSKYFKSKSGALSFIKRTVAEYTSIMGEIIN